MPPGQGPPQRNSTKNGNHGQDLGHQGRRGQGQEIETGGQDLGQISSLQDDGQGRDQGRQRSEGGQNLDQGHREDEKDQNRHHITGKSL